VLSDLVLRQFHSFGLHRLQNPATLELVQSLLGFLLGVRSRQQPGHQNNQHHEAHRRLLERVCGSGYMPFAWRSEPSGTRHRRLTPGEPAGLLQSCEFARRTPWPRNWRGHRPKRLRNNQLKELRLSKPTASAIVVTGWSVSRSNLRAARKRQSCRNRIGVWWNANLNVWWKW